VIFGEGVSELPSPPARDLGSAVSSTVGSDISKQVEIKRYLLK